MKPCLRISFASCLALLTLVAGCVTPETPSTAAAHKSGPPAICHVCQYNNDLACVCVKVDDHTPKTEYQGTTYYFCSEDCKAAFLKKPEKYRLR